MSEFENGEAYINHIVMIDKAQTNGTVSTFSWPDAGKEAFYIHNLLELASNGQILWKVLIVILLWW